jgi:hypothetical protein
VDACLRPLYDEAAIENWIAAIDETKFARVSAMGEDIFVGLVGPAPVGFVSCLAEMSLLGMWYVDPGFIGQGHGSTLLAHAESSLLAEGCVVATTEASLFARPHFESRGWVPLEEFDKPAFGGVFRVTRMSKEL